jgi:transcriptional regulator with XRE-family HTH domain
MVPPAETVGEHIKCERLRRGLRQRDLALAANADVWTVITWERHDVEPSVKLISAIIEWLGYDPFPVGDTFGEKIKWKRKKVGLTGQELGDLLSLSYCAIEQWERDVCKPRPANLCTLERVIGNIEVAEDGEELASAMNSKADIKPQKLPLYPSKQTF